MKILCLHGYTQSGSLFARKASGLRKLLSKYGHEMCFIDAPFKIQLDELPFEPSPDMEGADMRGWWCSKEGDPKYGDTTEAFKTVKAAVEKSGPFDGVLGFSQGAGLAAVVTKALPTICPEHPPLKFAIIYSGFKLKAQSAQHWYETKFTTPSLHIIGTLDTVVSEERSMKLVDCWETSNCTVLKHPGGHYVPSQKPMLESVASFLSQIENPHPAEKAEDNQADDWSAFDSIGK